MKYGCNVNIKLLVSLSEIYLQVYLEVNHQRPIEVYNSYKSWSDDFNNNLESVNRVFEVGVPV